MKMNCLACSLLGLLGGLALIGLTINSASAAEPDKKAQPIALGEGQLTLAAPASWERKQPRSRIVEHEFAAIAVEGDDQAGRMTIMGAGGSVDDNIKRWIGQFSQADGSDSAKAAKVVKKKLAGLEVQIVDLAGTYKDMPAGPFAGGKTTERPNYRMLAAIIVGGPELGNYFVKFYGPKGTIDANADAFHSMIDSLEKK